MRFLNYLLYDLNCYRKEKIVFAAVIFITIISQAICTEIGGVVAGFLLGVTVPLLAIFISLGIMYMASHFGYPFRKKQTSISFLMLPASTTEKFCARFINQVIVPVLIAVLSFVAAMFVLFLVNLFVDVTYYQTIIDGFLSGMRNVPEEFVVKYAPFVRKVLLLMGISITCQLCIYTFGSLIFGRYAIIKTLIAYTVFSWIISPLLYNTSELYIKAGSLQTNNDLDSVVEFFDSLMSPSFYVYYGVFSIALLVASYILFKQKTIIKTGI